MDIKSSIALSSHVASTGIGLAITGTRFGLGIARAVTGSLATVAGTVLDHTLSLSTPQTPFTSGPASLLLSSLTSSSWDVIDALAITPLILSQSITTTSLSAAANVAHTIFGSNTESDFSLGAFVSLVQREVLDEEQRERLPPGLEYSFMSVLKALGAWGALQGVTSRWADGRMLEGMSEVNVERVWGGMNQSPLDGERRASESEKNQVAQEEILITKTEEVHDSNGGLDATVITAELGHPTSTTLPSSSRRPIPTSTSSSAPLPSPNPPSDFRSDVLRYANICLGSYGGAGMLFFGIAIPKKETKASSPSTTTSAEKELVVVVEKAIDAESASTEKQTDHSKEQDQPDVEVEVEKKIEKDVAPGFFSTVFGKYDQHIFEHFAEVNTPPDASSSSSSPPKLSIAALQAHGGLPRFWVLTDHTRNTVVLAIRGTMSLNELAIDLTCDASDFTPHTSSSSPSSTSSAPGGKPKSYHVHSGMMLLAEKMGREGGKVHSAVKAALKGNEGYSLTIAGHSLGAGVGGLLGLLWSDVDTCETSLESGLPQGRKMKVWAFACPCITSPSLSYLSRNLITSIVLSYDLVARLSLGSIRDLRAVSDWLNHALKAKPEEGGVDGLLGRMGRFKLGGKGRWIDLDQRQEEEDFFLSLRKTLSAQMQSQELYPAGTTYLLLQPNDLHPDTLASASLLPLPDTRTTRVFKVDKPEKVFSEIVFDPAMLSCHLPQKYAAALKELF